MPAAPRRRPPEPASYGRGSSRHFALRAAATEAAATETAGVRGEAARRHTAEPALAAVELGNRRVQFAAPEVGPHHLGEVEFGVRAFPQQEVAQPALAAGANDQVHVLCRLALARLTRHQLAERRLPLLSAGGKLADPFGGSENRVARRVVDGQPQQQTLTAAGSPLGRGDRGTQIRAEAIAAADHLNAHAVRDALVDLAVQMALEQAQQQAHLARRTVPVVGRERVQGEHAHAAVGGGAHARPHRLGTDAMTEVAAHPLACRPATVAVHDDSDMQTV